MTIDRAQILVVAATTNELAATGGWRTLECGVGPVDAAARTAATLAQTPPAAVLHIGIAGVRRAFAESHAIAPTACIIGSESHYCDLGVAPKWAPSVVAPSPLLLHAVQRALPDAHALIIGTSGRIGGTSACALGGCHVEAMEGFAVLRAAQLANVPAIEVRVISNHIEETDRAQWHFADAFATVARITPILVDRLVQALRDA